MNKITIPITRRSFRRFIGVLYLKQFTATSGKESGVKPDFPDYDSSAKRATLYLQTNPKHGELWR